MKTNCWLLLGTMIATSAVAQVKTPAPSTLPAIPPPALTTPAAPATIVAPVETKTNAPAKKPVIKAKKKAIVKKTAKPAAPSTAAKPVAKKAKASTAPTAPVTLVPGTATVTSEKVNLRGQAGLKGEVVGHAKKGDTVTVIAEINLDKHAADEPAQWAKIALPTGTKVWINSKFVDATNKVVTAKKLNLRGGPGENFSVLGNLEKGAAFTPVTSKGDWTQIETPANAFAFVAANFLKQEGAPTEPLKPTEPAKVITAPEPLHAPETTNTVTEPPAIVPSPAPTVTEPPAPTATTPPPTTPAIPVVTNPAPAAEVVDTNPPPPRIVTHEGYVRPSVSIVAPTYYELYDVTTGNAINYLFSPTTNLNVGRYNGYQIVVTGEEGLEARWKDTPVLTIQKIYVTSTNAPTAAPAPASEDKPLGPKKH